MPRQLLTSGEISGFFEPTRRDAQEILPLLVRRLIVASSQPGAIGALRVPGGDDIRLPGWDGRLTFAGAHPYIPAGNSVWEMGVGDDPESKATSDLKKRSSKPVQGVTTADKTFVFVTPHVWPGKQKWISARKKTSAWRDIQVVDAQTLSEWADMAPAVAVWFHQARGTPSLDVEDVEASWVRLIQEPIDRTAPPSLVIAGRQEAADKLTAWLKDPRGDLEVAGESSDEVLAFVSAVVKSAATTDTPLDLSPSVLVARSKNALLYVGALQTPQIVVVSEPSLAAEFKAARPRFVSLIVPVPRPAEQRTTGGAVDIQLTPLRREAVEKTLESLDYRRDVAGRIATESRGSLQALLWGLGTRSMRGLPWLQHPAATQLSPLVLAHRWAVIDHPDHKALAKLADRDYRDVASVAAEWRKPGGPLQVWGPLWDWKAWRVAWEHLAPAFTPDLIKRFNEVCREVLGTRDPALDLPPEDRHMANVHGKVHPYSGAFRDGLISSIAMFGALSDRLPGIDAQGLASGLVRELLGDSESVDSWLSLGSWLPDLAEASPDVFLDAAERLAGNAEAAAAMFHEGGMFGATSPHVHLLWALERLAWSPALLSRVTLALGRFAERDPGGGLMNRPKNTLREIFLPWAPNTSATVDQRLAAFDQLIKRTPEVAWRLALSLMPQNHDHGSPTVRPQYREWAITDKVRPTPGEYRAFITGLVERAVALAGHAPDRWQGLAVALPGVFQHDIKAGALIAKALLALDPTSWSRESRTALGETLRDLLQRHEELPNSDWAVRGRGLQALRRAARKFAPVLTRDRERWLFETSPNLPGWSDGSFEEHDKRVEAARLEVLGKVRQEEGLPGLLAWASEVEAKEIFGSMLAKLPLEDEDAATIERETLLAESAANEQSVARRVGHGFVRSREAERGESWGRKGLRRVEQSLGVAAAVRFALALRPTPDLWRHLEAEHPSLVRPYWERANVYPLTLEEGEYMATRLMDVGRHFGAIGVVGPLVHRAKKDDTDKAIIERTLALCQLVTKEPPSHDPSQEFGARQRNWIGHLASEILDFVEKHADSPESQQLIVRWEWLWLPVFEHSGRGLRGLCREVSRSPEFFVELLRLVHRGKNEPSPVPNGDEQDSAKEAQQQARATQAWKLLRAWKTLPGLTTPADAKVPVRGNTIEVEGSPVLPPVTGTIDAGKLKNWVEDARRLATDCDRIGVCDSYIGGVLAFSPADADGRWPAAPVRELIEDLASQSVESGFRIGMLNRRGPHGVGATGSAERAIRDAYLSMAEKIHHESSRTAAILRALGGDYDAEAKQRDDEGHRREFHDD